MFDLVMCGLVVIACVSAVVERFIDEDSPR